MRIVTAAVITDGSRVLLARRAPGEKLAGLWEFPGGKVEEGETLEKCLAREVLEELGLEVNVGKVIAESVYEYAEGSIKLVALCAKVVTGIITLSVHDETAWVDIHNFAAYPLAPADISIAEHIREHIRSVATQSPSAPPAL